MLWFAQLCCMAMQFSILNPPIYKALSLEGVFKINVYYFDLGIFAPCAQLQPQMPSAATVPGVVVCAVSDSPPARGAAASTAGPAGTSDDPLVRELVSLKLVPGCILLCILLSLQALLCPWRGSAQGCMCIKPPALPVKTGREASSLQVCPGIPGTSQVQPWCTFKQSYRAFHLGQEAESQIPPSSRISDCFSCVGRCVGWYYHGTIMVVPWYSASFMEDLDAAWHE